MRIGQITRRFAEVGDMLGMPLLDHVITNGETYFSFVEGGSERIGRGLTGAGAASHGCRCCRRRRGE
jgi:hypothetical protein